VYRDDVIHGLIALAARTGEPGCECFNLSSGMPTSIRELALTACRVAHVEPRLIETGPEAGDKDDRVVLSTARLSEYGPWHPIWSLEDGLRQTLSERGMTQDA
jgi:nucleoside-diphosphate-sugar epimerase